MMPQEKTPRTWEHKVEAVIRKFARIAFEQANFDRSGRQYKRYRPYTLPEEAMKLVEILGWHDREAAEIAAKECMEQLRREQRPID